MRNSFSLLANVIVTFAFLSGATAFADDTATPALKAAEAEYYRIVTLPIPEGVALEAGALQWMGNGRLAASTRQGDIYFIDNTLDDPPAKLKFTKFASGLHEVLGLTAKDGWIY